MVTEIQVTMIEKVKIGTLARSESNGGSDVLLRSTMVPDRASTVVKLQRLIGDNRLLFDGQKLN